MADPTTPDLSALSPATTEEAWRKDPAKGFIRPEGPKLVRDPTPQPAPAAAAAALKRDPTPLPKRDEAPQPAPAANSYLSKAIEPITTYLPTQRQMAQEGVSQIGRGLSQLFRRDEDTGKWYT